MSCDNDATRGFGPLLPGHLKVDFGDAVGLEKIFEGLDTFFFLFNSFWCLFDMYVLHPSTKQDNICVKSLYGSHLFYLFICIVATLPDLCTKIELKNFSVFGCRVWR